MKTNDRVRVEIRAPETWAQGAPEILNGLTGTVEKVTERRLGPGPGEGVLVQMALVRFDAHDRGHWHRNAEPKNVAAFHFDTEELVLLDE